MHHKEVSYARWPNCAPPRRTTQGAQPTANVLWATIKETNQLQALTALQRMLVSHVASAGMEVPHDSK